MQREGLGLNEILGLRGLKSTENTKLVRHQDKRMDVKMLRRQGFFDYYQRTQSKDVFKCDRIVSFIGDEDGRAIFCGVYKVNAGRAVTEFEAPPGFPYPQYLTGSGFEYDLEKEPGYEDLEDRVVINWGDAPLAWHQWYQDKEVVEVLPKGFVMDWPGYELVLLHHADLKRIVDNRTANREWFRRLSAVAGVYCILQEETGELYVGSACGKEGIWGRWSTYANTVHGGNVLLKERCEMVPGFKEGLVYSILKTMPLSTSKEEVLAAEASFKRKLGSRAFGLTAN